MMSFDCGCKHSKGLVTDLFVWLALNLKGGGDPHIGEIVWIWI